MVLITFTTILAHISNTLQTSYHQIVQRWKNETPNCEGDSNLLMSFGVGAHMRPSSLDHPHSHIGSVCACIRNVPLTFHATTLYLSIPQNYIVVSLSVLYDILHYHSRVTLYYQAMSPGIKLQTNEE